MSVVAGIVTASITIASAVCEPSDAVCTHTLYLPVAVTFPSTVPVARVCAESFTVTTARQKASSGAYSLLASYSGDMYRLRSAPLFVFLIEF